MIKTIENKTENLGFSYEEFMKVISPSVIQKVIEYRVTNGLGYNPLESGVTEITNEEDLKKHLITMQKRVENSNLHMYLISMCKGIYLRLKE